MPRQPRNFKPNSFYHIFNRGNNKEAVLHYSSDKQFFISLLYKYKNICNIQLVSYCIMDTHFHLIIRTGDDPKTLSTFMQKVTTSFASQINSKSQRYGHVFQGRFNANYLPYKTNLKRAMTYVRRNPVVDGLVKKSSDYPWNSRD